MRESPLAECRSPQPLKHARALLATMAMLACVPGCRSSEPRDASASIRLSSGMAADFTNDLVTHFNSTNSHIEVKADVLDGSVVIATAIQQGTADLGIVQADVAYLAYRHGIDNARYPHTNLRGISVLWVNNLYVVVRSDSHISDISDLRGMKVGVPIKGTSGEFVTRVMLRAYGLTYDDIDEEFERGSAMAQNVEGRRVDAAIVSYPFFIGESNPSLRLLPIRRDISNRQQMEYPFFRRILVPASPPLAGGEIETVGTEALLVCRADLTEEVVYQLTKQFFSGLPAFAKRSREAALIDPEQGPATAIPLHPGAARFYRERELLQ